MVSTCDKSGIVIADMGHLQYWKDCTKTKLCVFVLYVCGGGGGGGASV